MQKGNNHSNWHNLLTKKMFYILKRKGRKAARNISILIVELLTDKFMDNIIELV